MNTNTIRFKSIICYRAEAIFGDMIEILYNGEIVWYGPVNTNNTIELPVRRYRIPGGNGGGILINQWYFGQPKETVFAASVVQEELPEDGRRFMVNEWFDGDPGGVYELLVQTSLESWAPS